MSTAINHRPTGPCLGRSQIRQRVGSPRLLLESEAPAPEPAVKRTIKIMMARLAVSIAVAGARAAIVLACASKSYFLDLLESAGAQRLVLTTGLMAPEAYTLDAAVRAWVGDGSTEAVVDAAAAAYDRYQKCGLRAARRLFRAAP